MARSLKKGFYVNEKILQNCNKMNASGDKKIIKVWDRACHIVPEMVGFTFAVHNGKQFVSVYVTEDMLGHRLGEFVPTRTFK
jgi:small subunit ribosomal protein S19